MVDDVGKISGWTAAQLSSERIHWIVFHANRSWQDGDYFQWFKAVDNLFREAYPKLSKREVELGNKYYNEVSPLVLRWRNAILKMDNSQGKFGHMDYAEATTLLTRKLRDYDMAVRTMLDNHGFLLPDKHDPGQAINIGTG